MIVLLVAIAAHADPPAETAPEAPVERTVEFTLAENVTLQSVRENPKKGTVVGTCGKGKAAQDVLCKHVDGDQLSCWSGTSKPVAHFGNEGEFVEVQFQCAASPQ